MRKVQTVALSLPVEIIDRLRGDAAKLGLSVSGYAKLVIVAGLNAPLAKALSEGGESDGPEV